MEKERDIENERVRQLVFSMYLVGFFKELFESLASVHKMNSQVILDRMRKDRLYAGLDCRNKVLMAVPPESQLGSRKTCWYMGTWAITTSLHLDVV